MLRYAEMHKRNMWMFSTSNIPACIHTYIHTCIHIYISKYMLKHVDIYLLIVQSLIRFDTTSHFSRFLGGRLVTIPRKENLRAGFSGQACMA